MTFRRRGSGKLLATLVGAVCLLGLGIQSPQAAPAPDPKRQARDVMSKGSALFRQGDYEGALRRFNEAQALYPSPKIYFNLGQTYRKMDRVEAAVEAFEKFLAEAPDADPARRKDAEKFLVELRPRLEAIRAATPSPQPAAPDGAPKVEQPEPVAPVAPVAKVAPAPAPAPPAPPRLVLEPPSESSATPALDSGGVAQPERAPARRRWWPWGVAAGVVVGGGIAAALLITREGPLPTGTLGFADRRTP